MSGLMLAGATVAVILAGISLLRRHDDLTAWAVLVLALVVLSGHLL